MVAARSFEGGRGLGDAADGGEGGAEIVGASVVTLTVPATNAVPRAWDGTQLYREGAPDTRREFALTFVPYFAWGNRGDTEMSVWLPRR